MKKPTKIYSLFPLLMATALIALMSGCLAGGVPDEYQPPSGHGYVRVSLGSMRTILPDEAVALASLTHFKLEFTSTDVMINATDYYTSTIDRLKAEVGSPIPLPVGTYNLEVTGYKGSISDSNATAEASYTDIEIEDDAPFDLTIDLQGIISGAGNGTFSWTIGLSNVVNLGTATMVISPAGDPTPTSTVLLMGMGARPNSTENLPVGYYDVLFTLTKNADGGNVVFTFKQILWVYKNLTSTFSFDFLDSYFTIGRYTVTYNYNSYPSMTNQTADVIRGASLTSLTLPPANTGLNPAYPFGWYTTSTNAPNHSDETDWGTKITSLTPSEDTTIHLRWLLIDDILPGTGIGIDFGYSPLVLTYSINSGAVTGSIANGGTITVYSNEQVVITITNGASFSNIQWDCHNVKLGNNMSAITIDTSSNPINSIGKYPVFVTTNENESFFFIIDLLTGTRT